MNINAGWYAALRTGAQALWGLIAAWLAARGIELPSVVADFFVETVAIAGVIALVTKLIRWMEARPGEGWFDRACRAVAKLLMLGLSRPPVYPVNPPSRPSIAPVAVQYEDGRSRTAL
jgi:hypothetical protein